MVIKRNSARQWLNYYATSLTDGDMIEVADDEIKQRLILNSSAVLLDKVSLERAYQKLYQRLPQIEGGERKPGDVFDLELSVFISPFYMVEVNANNIKKPKRVFPFWIPALLLATGELRPPTDDKIAPWFIRSVLDPMPSVGNIASLGNLTDVLDVLTKHEFSTISWSEYWESSCKFFHKITEANFDNIQVEGATIVHEYSLVNSDKKVEARSIAKLYARLQRDNKTPKLLNHILSNQFMKQESLPRREISFLQKGHYGQFNNKFPLSPSQRESLLTFIKEEHSTPTSVLAVNGPPGTGKTTLLQSVVANEMVYSALAGSKPKRIVASSTNNKAITNILDSFGNTSSLKRWLPKLSSLGVYMISGDEQKQLDAIRSGYQLLRLTRDGLEGHYFDHHENPHRSLEQFELYYKAAYATAYDSIAELSIKNITDELYEELLHKSQLIDKVIGTYQKIAIFENDSEYKLSDLSILQENICQQKEQKEKILARKKELITFKTEVFDAFFVKHKAPLLTRIIGTKDKEYNNRVQLFLSTTEYASYFKTCNSREEAEQVLLEILEEVNNELNLVNKQIDRLDKLAVQCEELLTQQQEVNDNLQLYWKAYLAGQGEKAMVYKAMLSDAELHIERIQIILDLTLRYDCFVLAVHYWEGQWLLHQQKGPYKNTKGVVSRLDVFKRISYLTPLFVSTFHMLPSYCSAFTLLNKQWKVQPIYEAFDVLIVDEAGQVSPEIGLPSMSFAKYALIVGDVHQIEPVWNIASAKVDKANLDDYNLLKEHSYETWKDRGVLCTSGNLMSLAQNASKYKVSSELGGTMLVEHRRCVDELVAFSNECVYKGLLKPMVGSKGNCQLLWKNETLTLPPFGYINIRSRSERRYGSTCNEYEAQAIAQWIKYYTPHILHHYAKESGGELIYKDISECIAVITPFTAQAKVIREAFIQEGVSTQIGIGTVHTFQGAEVPIVVFSPTYGANTYGRSFFFDRGYNMLNVAITRAKDHFIVIGNMCNFRINGMKKPSTILAKYLMSSENNELPSSFLYQNDTRFHCPTNRLDKLERHQACLKYTISKATNQVVIVSPFISIYAIEADGLVTLIKEAVSRGVRVIVYTDAQLDVVNRTLKESSSRGRSALLDAGVDLRILNGIHNKAIAMDDIMLVEGSFNWLSAIRDQSHPYFRHEVSQVLQGVNAQREIPRLLKDLEDIEHT